MENQNAAYILTEIWNAKTSWLNLTESQRRDYFDNKINPLLMGMV